MKHPTATRRAYTVAPFAGRRHDQGGAALAVGIILLLILTILAITGMSTATLELRMAGNRQFQERAFQAAEVGIERAMNSGLYSTSVPSLCPGDGCKSGTTAGNTVANELAGAKDDDSFTYTMRFDTDTGSTIVPGGGYSLGTGLQAYHFVVESTGTSQRDAQSTNVQSFYIIGPGG